MGKGVLDRLVLPRSHFFWPFLHKPATTIIIPPAKKRDRRQNRCLCDAGGGGRHRGVEGRLDRTRTIDRRDHVIRRHSLWPEANRTRATSLRQPHRLQHGLGFLPLDEVRSRLCAIFLRLEPLWLGMGRTAVHHLQIHQLRRWTRRGETAFGMVLRAPRSRGATISSSPRVIIRETASIRICKPGLMAFTPR